MRSPFRIARPKDLLRGFQSRRPRSAQESRWSIAIGRRGAVVSPARWRCRQFFYYEPGHARSRERTRTRVLRRADTVKKRPEREPVAVRFDRIRFHGSRDVLARRELSAFNWSRPCRRRSNCHCILAFDVLLACSAHRFQKFRAALISREWQSPITGYRRFDGNLVGWRLRSLLSIWSIWKTIAYV